MEMFSDSNGAMFSEDTFLTSGGKVRTQSLFWEANLLDPQHVVFTMKDNDHTVQVNGCDRTCVSLKKLYLSYCTNDPTEVSFADAVFGQWRIWTTIRNSPFVRPYVQKWEEEVAVRIKSESIKLIAQEARSGGRSAFSAAKLLLDKGWLPPDPKTSRKDKEQKEQEQRENEQASVLVNSDLERLGFSRTDGRVLKN